MADDNIIVLGFEGKSKAEDMLSLFEQWAEQGWITIEDAVVAVRGPGQEVEIKQTQSLTGKFAARGTGLGLAAGLLLGGPIGGLVAGATIGAIAGKMKDIGIDDDFVREATAALRPDSSALFLMGRTDDPERFYQELKPHKAIVASTSLSPEQERQLRDALAEEE
jgi:uncharacterized membrane protein